MYMLPLWRFLVKIEEYYDKLSSEVKDIVDDLKKNPKKLKDFYEKVVLKRNTGEEK